MEGIVVVLKHVAESTASAGICVLIKVPKMNLIVGAPASTKNVLADSRYDNNDYGQRIAFYHIRGGQGLYTRRSLSVEAFNEWFKSLFELHQTVWL